MFTIDLADAAQPAAATVQMAPKAVSKTASTKAMGECFPVDINSSGAGIRPEVVFRSYFGRYENIIVSKPSFRAGGGAG